MVEQNDAEERLDRYREASAKAGETAAELKDAELRNAYLAIRAAWRCLADELERELKANEYVH